MEAHPKPRHQYIYTPRYGQRGYLTYAGQTPNGAPATGVIPNGGGVGYGYGAVGAGAGVGVGVAGGYYPAVHAPSSYYQPSHAYYAHNYYGTSGYYPTPAYSSYYNFNLYGSMYPLANFYHPYQRHSYNTAPGYGYGYAQQAYVYPPGPSATTTTTTYHVTNGPRAYTAQPAVPIRDDYQLENRRVATERGAYAPRPIKPADARSDDPFWCRERNGEWHLRTYYQIENECYPGRWRMDPEIGFLVFHRE
jgi:hypothetical protein